MLRAPGVGHMNNPSISVKRFPWPRGQVVSITGERPDRALAVGGGVRECGTVEHGPRGGSPPRSSREIPCGTSVSEGQAIRRHIQVRAKTIVGLGKEANRIEDARVLGLRSVGGRAKRYVDPDPFLGSATEVAKWLGVSRRTVFNLRRGFAPVPPLVLAGVAKDA
jgi:hypothetical protein